MKFFTILAILWGALMGLYDHQFKRELRVPHYDACGEEVTVEDSYVKEWMRRNRCLNPGFEEGSEGEPSPYWPGGDLAVFNVDEQRSGDACIRQEMSGKSRYSYPVELPMLYNFGFSAGIYIKSSWAFGTTPIVKARVGYKYGTAWNQFTVIEEFTTSAEIKDTDGYVLFRINKAGYELTPGSTHVQIQIVPPDYLGHYLYLDDAHISIHNPHHLISFDDFASLNVEDLETFTFGQNYDLDESGGLPLSDSNRTADDPVNYLRMADASSERVKLRDPIDVFNLSFLLFSREQQIKLLDWYKRTRGLTFYWLDEFQKQREVQWALPPEIMPRGNNPDIATVSIVLESASAGE